MVEMFFFLKSYKAVVQGWWKPLKIQPNIKGAGRRNVDVDVKFVKASQDVVTLLLEMFLKGYLFHCDVSWVEERDSCQLHAISMMSSTL